MKYFEAIKNIENTMIPFKLIDINFSSYLFPYIFAIWYRWTALILMTLLVWNDIILCVCVYARISLISTETEYLFKNWPPELLSLELPLSLVHFIIRLFFLLIWKFTLYIQDSNNLSVIYITMMFSQNVAHLLALFIAPFIRSV